MRECGSGYMSVCMCLRVYVCMSVCVWGYLSVCLCVGRICLRVCGYMRVYPCVSVCMSGFMSACECLVGCVPVLVSGYIFTDEQLSST